MWDLQHLPTIWVSYGDNFTFSLISHEVRKEFRSVSQKRLAVQNHCGVINRLAQEASFCALSMCKISARTSHRPFLLVFLTGPVHIVPRNCHCSCGTFFAYFSPSFCKFFLVLPTVPVKFLFVLLTVPEQILPRASHRP